MSVDNRLNSFRTASIPDLIRDRAKLISDIRKFEKNDLPSDAWLMDPRPDMVYLENLKLLAGLCEILAEKYIAEHAE